MVKVTDDAPVGRLLRWARGADYGVFVKGAIIGLVGGLFVLLLSSLVRNLSAVLS